MLIAERNIQGIFTPLPGYSGGRVMYLPNAGLLIKNATVDDSGLYSVIVSGEDSTGTVTLTSQINVTVNSKYWC